LREGASEESIRLLNDLVPILQRSINETRMIYMGLKPTMLADRGILATLEWRREQLMSIYSNVHIELETEIGEEEIREELKTVKFRH
jgi:signal transduction histidine kinase